MKNKIKKIIQKIKTYKQRHQKELEYKKYIQYHKDNVIKAFYELLYCTELEWLTQDDNIINALWIRALEHDNSKFSPEEFDGYRSYYFPIDEEEKQQSQPLFDKAWEHHLMVNDHHWQHRIHWNNEDFNTNVEIACLENLLDWMAMGYDKNNRPYEYYEQHKNEINLPQKQLDFMEKCIYEGIDKKYIILRQARKENENDFTKETEETIKNS